VEIESAFTHFAKADYVDKSFAEKQFKEYNDFIAKVEAKGVIIPIHQCANSAAMMEMPETSLTISRAGISMYGLYPSEEMDKDNMKLIPAMSIYSHVVYVKNIEKGRGVSYGQTFVADKPMTIATIPVGYGDGYPRNLSNKGYVLINGKKCNILGRVCMDQFMVDVTGMDVKEGDKVTLAGKDGSEEILIDDLAALAGTFNYEFVCDLGKRVPRVFVKDGKIVGTKDYFEDDYEVEI
jgi:alanine racemase